MRITAILLPCRIVIAPGIQAVHILYRQPAAMAGNGLLTRRLNLLRQAMRLIRQYYLFIIHSWVVLPSNFHRTFT
jgi:hypothetical protein